MQKIPSLFVRDWSNKECPATPEVTPGCEWVFRGEGVATIKMDGSACMVRDGKLFKRYDRKLNKKTGKHKRAPEGWEQCSDPLENGHWPGWVPCDRSDPNDRWHWEAWDYMIAEGFWLPNRTYELVGPRLQGNPYNNDKDTKHLLFLHGDRNIVGISLTYEGIREWLEENIEEGIVFHHLDGRMAKVKRRDFGISWPVK